MIQDTLSTKVKTYSASDNSTMDFLQIQFSCCGSKNYTEYKENDYFINKTNIYVPDSCCNAVTSKTTYPSDDDKIACQGEAKNNTASPKQLRNVGCYYKIIDFLHRNGAIIIGVVVGIACLEMLGIIFAACLIRNRTDYWDWDQQ